MSEGEISGGKDKSNPDRPSERHPAAEIELVLRDHLDDNFRKLRKDLEETLYERLKDHKEELDTSVRRYGKRALTFLSLVAVIMTILGLGGIYQAYRRGMAFVEKQVSERLEQEFQTERITNLVDAKAKQYTETEAQKYISKQVQATITPFQNELRDAVSRADSEVGNLNSLFVVYLLADEAQIGSKKAYIELQDLAAKSTPQGKVARNSMIQIVRSLQRYQQPPVMYQDLQANEDRGVIPFKQLSLDEIVERMENPYFPDEYRHTCMVYVQEKPRGEVFRKVLEVLQHSDSLPTCAAFCGVLSKISDEKSPFLDFEGWIRVCQSQLRK